MSISLIPIEEIIPPAQQMRIGTDDREMESLKCSIRDNGLINPITVTNCDGKYEVVAGYRRYYAMKELGFTVVPAIERTANKVEALKIKFDENYERVQINLIEEAHFLTQTLEANNWTQVQLAMHIRKTPAYVSERLKIMNYPTPLLEALAAGHINFAIAREFARCDNEEQIAFFVVWARQYGCSWKTARFWVSDWRRDQTVSPEPPVSSEPQPVLATQPDTRPTRLCDFCGMDLEYRDSVTFIVHPGCKSVLIEAVDEINTELVVGSKL